MTSDPRTVCVSADGRELRGLLPDPSSGRVIIGIAGAPGAGKSTLSEALGAPVVPLDGFHLADVELSRRGLLQRKGAPETFDAWGYAALLARLRSRPDHMVMAPGFERDLEQPLAGAVPIAPEAGLVLTEGNYLLLDEPAWRSARAAMGVVWHVVVDDDVRRARLVARHIAFGKSLAAATAWVEEVDEPNAVVVDGAASRADLLLDLTEWRPKGELGRP